LTPLKNAKEFDMAKFNTSRSLAVVAVLAASGLMTVTSAQAEACNVATRTSAWGTAMSGTFEISAGESCFYGIRMGGTVNSSKIAKPAQHGSVRMIDLSTFEYKSRDGYVGPDSFAIEADGHSPSSSGTSIITVHVVVK
jgi:hypothetical protein